MFFPYASLQKALFLSLYFFAAFYWIFNRNQDVIFPKKTTSHPQLWSITFSWETLGHECEIDLETTPSSTGTDLQMESN